MHIFLQFINLKRLEMILRVFFSFNFGLFLKNSLLVELIFFLILIKLRWTRWAFSATSVHFPASSPGIASRPTWSLSPTTFRPATKHPTRTLWLSKTTRWGVENRRKNFHFKDLDQSKSKNVYRKFLKLNFYIKIYIYFFFAKNCNKKSKFFSKKLNKKLNHQLYFLRFGWKSLASAWMQTTSSQLALWWTITWDYVRAIEFFSFFNYLFA